MWVELWIKMRVVVRVVVLERMMRLVTMIGTRVGPAGMRLLVGRSWNLCASVLGLPLMVNRGNDTIQVLLGTIAKREIKRYSCVRQRC